MGVFTVCQTYSCIYFYGIIIAQMPPTNQKVIFLRRISALLIFFVVLLAFAALFYYKYIPANKEELNQRGHRVLTQLTRNFLNKDGELREIIQNAFDEDSATNLITQKEGYARLNDNIPYDIVPKNSLPANFSRPFYRQDNGDWRLLYKTDTANASPKPYLAVTMREFAGPLFSATEALFQNYFILLDSATDKEPTRHTYYILCKKELVCEAPDINMDTLKLLEKNSDKSGSFPVSIGGDQYFLCYAPFFFNNTRLLMAGLMPMRTYNEKLQSTPLYLLSITIILISLILSALPLLKIFLLSPNEQICSRDVIRTTVSFYIGSIIVTIIVFYSFLVFVTGMSLHRRLQTFSQKVGNDIEKEINLADSQLRFYDSAIGGRGSLDPIKECLHKDSATANDTYALEDSLCIPKIYPNVSRLMWGDSVGTTLAKWSPFTYATPFTDLSKYKFFKLLDEKPPIFDGTAGVEQPVVYPGKSNLTDEFLTCLARRSNAHFGNAKSYFVVLAVMLHSADPLVPKGFGYAVIDNTGKVLLDSDPDRNLSENLFEESGNDPLLSQIVRDRRSDFNFDLELYGEPYAAQIAPIAHQPLTVVCYYDERILTSNIFRYIHFSIHTLFIIVLLLIACLLSSTFDSWSPKLLNFKIDKMEWMRPSSTNRAERPFVFVYLLYLLTLTIVFFVAIVAISEKLDNLFYISILLPFYVMIGVQQSKVKNPGGQIWGLLCRYFLASLYPLVCVAVLNIIIWQLIVRSGSDILNFAVPLVFQLCILFVKPLIRWTKWEPWMKSRKNDFFRGSVYFSILLIGVLPTIGTLTYGFYAEKVQFKKDKMLRVSGDFFERSNYLLNSYFPTVKPQVLAKLGTRYQDSLIYTSGIYLTDRDTVIRSEPDTLKEKAPLADGLYSLLMDSVYRAPRIWGDEICIKDTTGDKSWRYGQFSGPAVAYVENRPVRDTRGKDNHIIIISGLQKPHEDFLRLSAPLKVFFGMVVLALLFLGKKIVHEAIQRLFLLDVVKDDKIVCDRTYIKKYFAQGEALKGTSYVNHLAIPSPFTTTFFDHERNFDTWSNRPVQFTQEEYILAMADYFKPVYESIWKDLSDEEKYILYDFSSDRYTNYKNSTLLYKLINKGVLEQRGECLDVFSLSFRQYVLSLKNTAALEDLKSKFKVSGTWDSIRIPVLAILAVVAVFLFMTQAAFSSGLVAAITAVCTLVPMIVRLFSKPAAAG